MKDIHEGRLVVKLPTFVLWSCTWPSTCFASGLHLEIVTENLAACPFIQLLEKTKDCYSTSVRILLYATLDRSHYLALGTRISFIQLLGQLLLSVFPALIRRCTPLSQVCITMELRMRGMLAHQHQASLADVWWSLGYELPTRRISYSPLRLARSSSAAHLLRTGPSWAAFLLGVLSQSAVPTYDNHWEKS